MSAFMWLIIANLALGLIVFVIMLFKYRRKTMATQKAAQPQQGGTQQTNPAPPAGQTAKPKDGSKFKRFFDTTFGIMALILMGILVIVALAAALLWFSHFDEKWGHFWNPPRPTYEKVWYAKDSVVVNFTAKFGEPIKMSEGDQLSFKHESENFCVKNRDSVKVCGNGNEVGQRLPNTRANTLLWFQSCDSLPGKVTIIFWAQKTVRK